MTSHLPLPFGKNDDLFVLENGWLAFYRYEDGKAVPIYRTRRLALAYDDAALVFERLGPPEEVMKWASERRTELRASGKGDEASRLAVVFLPTDLEPRNYNDLLDRPDTLVSFLQRIGLV